MKEEWMTFLFIKLNSRQPLIKRYTIIIKNKLKNHNYNVNKNTLMGTFAKTGNVCGNVCKTI